MKVGLNRRNIGRLVLLFWAVMLAWLARREFTRDEATRQSDRSTRLAPAAQYFAVFAGGRQIGQLNLTIDTLVDGVKVGELLVIDVPRDSGTVQLTRGTEFLLTRALRLRRVSWSVVGIGPQERLEGAVAEDSTLRLIHQEAPLGPAGRSRIPVDPEAVLPGTLPYRIAVAGRLHVGAEFSLPLIELGTGATTHSVAIRVTAESTFVVPDSAVWDSAGSTWIAATTDTIQAWRIEHDAPGAPTVSWVDAGGVLVHQSIAGGVELRRSAFEIVRNNYRALRREESQQWRRELPGMVALSSSGRVPDTVAAVRRFRLEQDSIGQPWAGTRGLAGGRQRRDADTLTIFRHTPADSAPDPPRDTETSWDLPVRDGGIEEAGMDAVRGARSLEDSARRLTRWVARQIATDTANTASVTALFSLRARRGSAEGKTRLLVAMARGRGIPARVVSGIALFPDGTYGHVWAELWTGRWTAADPSFGHFPASASLLRLGVGTTSRPIDLLFLAGSARFLPIRGPR
jgi:transglutaminase-like putative cysteine protease